MLQKQSYAKNNLNMAKGLRSQELNNKNSKLFSCLLIPSFPYTAAQTYMYIILMIVSANF